jgi:hypothetical protein
VALLQRSKKSGFFQPSPSLQCAAGTSERRAALRINMFATEQVKSFTNSESLPLLVFPQAKLVTICTFGVKLSGLSRYPKNAPDA